jgi:hypothetical protein
MCMLTLYTQILHYSYETCLNYVYGNCFCMFSMFIFSLSFIYGIVYIFCIFG